MCIYIYIYIYFRLRTKASGPEIVASWGLKGPLLQQNPLEKVGASPGQSRGQANGRTAEGTFPGQLLAGGTTAGSRSDPHFWALNLYSILLSMEFLPGGSRPLRPTGVGREPPRET